MSKLSDGVIEYCKYLLQCTRLLLAIVLKGSQHFPTKFEASIREAHNNVEGVLIIRGSLLTVICRYPEMKFG